MDTTMLAGRTTSRIGFGCGRLAGGAATRESAALLEAALALGITHFDLAPSYGLGLAENVAGEVLAGNPDVTIATKVGIGRPGNAGLKSLARQVLKPLLRATPALRARLARQAQAGADRNQFDPASVTASVEDSLKRLRRDCVDALLLHAPDPTDLTPTLSETLLAMEAQGRVRTLGSSSNGDVDTVAPFGVLTQCRWNPAAPAPAPSIVHGALRRFPQPAGDGWRATLGELGWDAHDPSAWPGFLLTLALATTPEGIVLVSSRDPARLAGAIGAIDWTAARGERSDFVERGAALLARLPA